MSDLMKNVLIAALGVSLVGSLQASASGAEAEKKPINLGTLKMAALTNPWVGVERGIFQKHGLDVKLVYFNSGAQAINAAQVGSIELRVVGELASFGRAGIKPLGGFTVRSPVVVQELTSAFGEGHERRAAVALDRGHAANQASAA